MQSKARKNVQARCSELVDHSRRGVRSSFRCSRAAVDGTLCAQHAKARARELDRQIEVLRTRSRRDGRLKRADAAKLAELEALATQPKQSVVLGDEVAVRGRVVMERTRDSRRLLAVSVRDADGRSQLIEISADQLTRPRGGRRG